MSTYIRDLKRAYGDDAQALQTDWRNEERLTTANVAALRNTPGFLEAALMDARFESPADVAVLMQDACEQARHTRRMTAAEVKELWEWPSQNLFGYLAVEAMSRRLCMGTPSEAEAIDPLVVDFLREKPWGKLEEHRRRPSPHHMSEDWDPNRRLMIPLAYLPYDYRNPDRSGLRLTETQILRLLDLDPDPADACGCFWARTDPHGPVRAALLARYVPGFGTATVDTEQDVRRFRSFFRMLGCHDPASARHLLAGDQGAPLVPYLIGDDLVGMLAPSGNNPDEVQMSEVVIGRHSTELLKEAHRELLRYPNRLRPKA